MTLGTVNPIELVNSVNCPKCACGSREPPFAPPDPNEKCVKENSADGTSWKKMVAQRTARVCLQNRRNRSESEVPVQAFDSVSD